MGSPEEDSEKKLLQQSATKPDPKLVGKIDKSKNDTDAVSAEDVKKIISKKLEKFEKKHAEFVTSVEKKHGNFEDILNKMSGNIDKIVSSGSCKETEAISSAEPTGSKESLVSCLQDSNENEDVEDDDTQEADQEEQSFVEGLQSFKIARRVKPSNLALDAWAKARKVTDDYQDEDWKKASEDSSIKNYTMHPAASPFKAPEADAECPVLFKDKKDMEKKHMLLQNMAGAAGH